MPLPLLRAAADALPQTTRSGDGVERGQVPRVHGGWRLVHDQAPWSARMGLAVASTRGVLVLAGGQSYGPDGALQVRYNDVWRSDDGLGQNWTLAVAHAKWSPRAFHALAADGSGKLWLAGGISSSAACHSAWSGPDRIPSCNDVWFSADKGTTWTCDLVHANWRPRFGHSLTLAGDFLYLFAGMGYGPNHQKSIRYVDNDLWKTKPSLGSPYFEDITTVVGQACLAGQDTCEGVVGANMLLFQGKLWVLGGGGSPYHPFDNKIMWITVPGQGDPKPWHHVTQEESPKRFAGTNFAGAVAQGGRMWIFGGSSCCWTLQANCACPGTTNASQIPRLKGSDELWYSSDGLHWEVHVPAMSSMQWPSSRAGHAMVPIKDGFLVLGGGTVDSSDRGTVHRDVWMFHAPPAPPAPSPTPGPPGPGPSPPSPSDGDLPVYQLAIICAGAGVAGVLIIILVLRCMGFRLCPCCGSQDHLSRYQRGSTMGSFSTSLDVSLEDTGDTSTGSKAPLLASRAMAKQWKSTCRAPSAEWLIFRSSLDLKRKIAEGAQGSVHEAIYEGCRVAVKRVFNQDWDKKFAEHSEESGSDALFQEVRVMKSIQHPNIVRLFGVAYEQPHLFIVTEYCPMTLTTLLFMDGRQHTESKMKGVEEEDTNAAMLSIIRKSPSPPLLSRAEIARTHGTLTRADCAVIAHQICGGMSFLHSKGVLHRDLKPDNVLLSEVGRVKICDFGVSRIVSGGKKQSKAGTKTQQWWRRTKTGKGGGEGDSGADKSFLQLTRLVGTPGFMAPELFGGSTHFGADGSDNEGGSDGGGSDEGYGSGAVTKLATPEMKDTEAEAGGGATVEERAAKRKWGATDVYAFGVLVWMLNSREEPYVEDRRVQHMSRYAFMDAVVDGMRPRVPTNASYYPTSIAELVEECWQSDPSRRPSFRSMRDRIMDAFACQGSNGSGEIGTSTRLQRVITQLQFDADISRDKLRLQGGEGRSRNDNSSFPLPLRDEANGDEGKGYSSD